jgi:hypothetical protein
MPPRIDCRARARGLRGQDARDVIDICEVEINLNCVKAAVERKVDRYDRRYYIRACIRHHYGRD